MPHFKYLLNRLVGEISTKKNPMDSPHIYICQSNKCQSVRTTGFEPGPSGFERPTRELETNTPIIMLLVILQDLYLRLKHFPKRGEVTTPRQKEDRAQGLSVRSQVWECITRKACAHFLIPYSGTDMYIVRTATCHFEGDWVFLGVKF